MSLLVFAGGLAGELAEDAVHGGLGIEAAFEPEGEDGEPGFIGEDQEGLEMGNPVSTDKIIERFAGSLIEGLRDLVVGDS